MKRTNRDKRLAALITTWAVLFVLAVGYIGYCNSEGQNQLEKHRLMKQTQLLQLEELEEK